MRQWISEHPHGFATLVALGIWFVSVVFITLIGEDGVKSVQQGTSNLLKKIFKY